MESVLVFYTENLLTDALLMKMGVLAVALVSAGLFHEKMPRTNPAWLKGAASILFLLVMTLLLAAIAVFSPLQDWYRSVLPNQDESSQLIKFLLVWMVLTSLIYCALRSEMNGISKVVFALLLAVAVSFELFPLPSLTALVTPMISEMSDEHHSLLFRIILAVFWLICSGLFFGAFHPRMARTLRLALALICGLMMVALLQTPLFQLLFVRFR